MEILIGLGILSVIILGVWVLEDSTKKREEAIWKLFTESRRV